MYIFTIIILHKNVLRITNYKLKKLYIFGILMKLKNHKFLYANANRFLKDVKLFYSN